MPALMMYSKKSEELSRKAYSSIVCIGAATILSMIFARILIYYLLLYL